MIIKKFYIYDENNWSAHIKEKNPYLQKKD